MSKILFGFSFLQLIYVISGASFSVDVIRDGTSTQEDMVKALALSKRFFWRNMMPKWSCYLGTKIEPRQFGVRSIDVLRKICESWRMKAMAADAYVKSWECKQQHTEKGAPSLRSSRAYKHKQAGEGASSSSSSTTLTTMAILNDQIDEEDAENPFKYLCVKPRFLVELGELQMSSAMEVIKTAYSVLFGWTKAVHSMSEMKFENEGHWDVVDRWLDAYKNSVTKFEMEKPTKMLIVAKSAMDDDDAYFDQFKILNFPEFCNAPDKTEIFENTMQLLIVATNDMVSYEETMENGTNRNYLSELKNLLKQFKKMTNKLLKRLKRGEPALQMMTDLKAAHDSYLDIWELIQELGLNMTTICEAAKEYQANYYDNFCGLKHFWLIKQKTSHYLDKIYGHLYGLTMHFLTEVELGPLLWMYKHVIHDPMMVKHTDEELENLLVLDPCNEAKLKLREA